MSIVNSSPSMAEVQTEWNSTINPICAFTSFIGHSSPLVIFHVAYY
jgi:hypothetical protein